MPLPCSQSLHRSMAAIGPPSLPPMWPPLRPPGRLIFFFFFFFFFFFKKKKKRGGGGGGGKKKKKKKKGWARRHGWWSICLVSNPDSKNAPSRPTTDSSGSASVSRPTRRAWSLMPAARSCRRFPYPTWAPDLIVSWGMPKGAATVTTEPSEVAMKGPAAAAPEANLPVKVESVHFDVKDGQSLLSVGLSGPAKLIPVALTGPRLVSALNKLPSARRCGGLSTLRRSPVL